MQYLNNQLLIAMPTLQDAQFQRSVIYLCEHNERGAIGIIINRPTELKLDYIFDQINLKTEVTKLHDIPVLNGGPVHQERGFVIHHPPGKWRSTLSVTEDFGVTTSQDILEAIANNEGPKHFLVALGYSAWEQGQLEEEIAGNYWLVGPATKTILFDTTFTQRRRAAAAGLGINIDLISGESGHA